MVITVLLCEDQPVFAHGLAALIQSGAPDLDVVGVAATCGEAERLARSLSPDIALVGLSRPGSVEAAQRVCSASPRTKVVMLAVSDERADLHQALKAGASGYVAKHADVADIVGVVRSVHRGHLVIPAHLVGGILRDPEAADPPDLSDAERDILAGIARGETNKEIARRQRTSERTVRRRVQVIYRKLHLSDRLEAAIYASQRGIGTDDAQP